MPNSLPPTPGTEISYNGHVFSGKAETVSIKAMPQLDAARRTISCVKYTITIKDHVLKNPAIGITTDADMDRIRARLMSQGGVFVYKDKGLGAFTINQGRMKDVAWGPTPIDCSYKLLGDKWAWELTFTIEVCIPDCPAAKFDGIMEWVYTLQTRIDKSGLTTRTISGHLTIALTRDGQGNRRVATTADKFRDRTYPAVPIGFDQTADFTLSEDRRTLRFTFVQSELGSNPLPPGVAPGATVSESISNEGLCDFAKWTVQFSGSYEIVKGQPTGPAIVHFMTTIEKRLAAIRQFKVQDPTYTILPASWTATEPNILGQKRMIQMSASFRLAGSVSKFLVAGLWEPVAIPGQTWDVWRKSMADTAQHPRGAAKLEFDARDDLIIDLCVPGDNLATLKSMGKRKPKVENVANLDTRRQLDAYMKSKLLANLDPLYSWLDYDVSIRLEPENSVAMHSALPEADGAGFAILRTPAAAGLTGPFRNPGFNRLISEQTSPPTIVQERSRTIYTVVLSGYAARVGFQIQPPTLLRALGGDCIPANDPELGDHFTHKIVGMVGLPIFGAAWQFRYKVAGARVGDLLEIPTDLLRDQARQAPLFPIVSRQGSSLVSGAIQ